MNYSNLSEKERTSSVAELTVSVAEARAYHHELQARIDAGIAAKEPCREALETVQRLEYALSLAQTLEAAGLDAPGAPKVEDKSSSSIVNMIKGHLSLKG